MALADTMVVMNHGLIEQVGSPHQVYNFPANEFVARFMGGHNVLQTASGLVAVRNDHMRIAAAQAPGASGLAAHITDIEYQGTYVLLGLQLADEAQAAPAMKQVAVLLHESDFLARPFELGQPVLLWWDEAHARALQPGAQRPAPRQPQPTRMRRDPLAAMAA